MDEYRGRLAGRKVLVTGASGFIGQRLVAALSRAGAEITALGRDRTPPPSLVAARVRWVRGALSDPAAVGAAVRVQEIVFNLAYDVRATGAANLDAFGTLLSAVEGEGRARIIHASSIVVYNDWPGGAFDESAPMDRPGGGPYRQAKIAMERRLMAGPRPAAILQPTIVWGPGSSLWTDTFAGALLRGAVILPQPEGLCQGVFVDDVVQGLMRAGARDDLAHERFILNGPAPFRWSDLIGGYRDLIGQGEIRFEPAAKLSRPAPPEQAEDAAPSPAARIGALGRRLIGRSRFETLARAARRHLPQPREMWPDAHLLALYLARGDCPATLASRRLGYAPVFGLHEGLAATAGHLRALAGRD